MNIKIYQINSKRDTENRLFMNLKTGETVNPEIYDKVFEGEVETDSLEGVFYIFNMNRPSDFIGHSMSVSDVVVSDDKAYICQNVGFKEIEFDTSLVPNENFPEFIKKHNIKYYEIEMTGGKGKKKIEESMCILGVKKPTIAEAVKFCVHDIIHTYHCDTVTAVREISQSDAYMQYDMEDNEMYYPIFGLYD
ncbi:MAG: hypothetical protein IJA32_11040 [Lachnospiraceae bacterium]|nr:hypothetical protein [Lachnospiraceae bacterium]